jgi:hypothetical protein
MPTSTKLVAWCTETRNKHTKTKTNSKFLYDLSLHFETTCCCYHHLDAAHCRVSNRVSYGDSNYVPLSRLAAAKYPTNRRQRICMRSRGPTRPVRRRPPTLPMPRPPAHQRCPTRRGRLRRQRCRSPAAACGWSAPVQPACLPHWSLLGSPARLFGVRCSRFGMRPARARVRCRGG